MVSLVQKYRKHTPQVTPLWDRTEASVQHNDIDQSIVRSGLTIFTADAQAVWAGLWEPSIYDADTLWKNLHDKDKIARVIEAWEARNTLSPIFLIKHGGENLGLVADGKHRLTVARFMGSAELPFMLQTSDSDWVRIAIPTARELLRTSH